MCSGRSGKVRNRGQRPSLNPGTARAKDNGAAASALLCGGKPAVVVGRWRFWLGLWFKAGNGSGTDGKPEPRPALARFALDHDRAPQGQDRRSGPCG
ncbi:hypothetical protein GGTG_06198 [Gaeumannomyces tritici R3-111a-1]|uniref:Uncharacterized protein n=1 Tax=Gaeumannomyces tritici (strain R3-111a-1) TaxID=644352 RepID=J3NY44_GAET3|nr:hypothetical protein GGTG_06198 [Gaeumannomyces tritici R3-111a-1]EJT76277.1 hypothetical protein GGTG_06198 [Gaeumannomyces tritici R3-111a-1]